jgi:hypothetical protein
MAIFGPFISNFHQSLNGSGVAGGQFWFNPIESIVLFGQIISLKTPNGLLLNWPQHSSKAIWCLQFCCILNCSSPFPGPSIPPKCHVLLSSQDDDLPSIAWQMCSPMIFLLESQISLNCFQKVIHLQV